LSLLTRVEFSAANDTVSAVKQAAAKVVSALTTLKRKREAEASKP
jgi:hypothetical protein